MYRYIFAFVYMNAYVFAHVYAWNTGFLFLLFYFFNLLHLLLTQTTLWWSYTLIHLHPHAHTRTVSLSHKPSITNVYIRNYLLLYQHLIWCRCIHALFMCAASCALFIFACGVTHCSSLRVAWLIVHLCVWRDSFMCVTCVCDTIHIILLMYLYIFIYSMIFINNMQHADAEEMEHYRIQATLKLDSLREACKCTRR